MGNDNSPARKPNRSPKSANGKEKDSIDSAVMAPPLSTTRHKRKRSDDDHGQPTYQNSSHAIHIGPQSSNQAEISGLEDSNDETEPDDDLVPLGKTERVSPGEKLPKFHQQHHKVRTIAFDSRSKEFLGDANVFVRHLLFSLDTAEKSDEPYWQRVYFANGRRLVCELSTNLLDLALYLTPPENKSSPGPRSIV